MMVNFSAEIEQVLDEDVGPISYPEGFIMIADCCIFLDLEMRALGAEKSNHLAHHVFEFPNFEHEDITERHRATTV